MSNTLMQKAREIYERLIEIIAAGEFYWYAQASDYQGKYSFSADYDKSFKSDYNEKAAICRETAEQMKQTAFPEDESSLIKFLEKLKADLHGFDELVRAKAEFQELMLVFDEIIAKLN